MNKIYNIEDFIYNKIHFNNDIAILKTNKTRRRNNITTIRLPKTLREIRRIKYDLDI